MDQLLIQSVCVTLEDGQSRHFIGKAFDAYSPIVDCWVSQSLTLPDGCHDVVVGFNGDVPVLKQAIGSVTKEKQTVYVKLRDGRVGEFIGTSLIPNDESPSYDNQVVGVQFSASEQIGDMPEYMQQIIRSGCGQTSNQ